MGLLFAPSPAQGATTGGDTELSLTLHNRRPELIDNIFTGTAFLNMMRARGGVEVDSTGGIGLVRALRFEKNDTADSFSGFDSFMLEVQDNETSAVFPWASLWAHVRIAWDEERRNSGQARMINLVNTKIDDAEMALRDELNIQLLQAPPGSGNKDLTTIRELIDSDNTFAEPARGDSIGGIPQNPASEAWWRNQIIDDNGNSMTVAQMNTMHNDVSDGSDTASFILGDQTSYELYEATQITNIRYAPADILDASFTALMFKQVPITWDPSVTTVNSLSWINTNYTKLVIHSEGQFVTSDFIEPDDGASKTAKILLMAQLICTNRRRNGIYIHDGS